MGDHRSILVSETYRLHGIRQERRISAPVFVDCGSRCCQAAAFVSPVLLFDCQLHTGVDTDSESGIFDLDRSKRNARAKVHEVIWTWLERDKGGYNAPAMSHQHLMRFHILGSLHDISLVAEDNCNLL
ncbi:hypothetical protein BDR06DRAFT_962965 [Suillus hirtellus]|nr:hypothetical protein BDR06DRAFT_962965 [Suillus hirtellus]